MVSGMGMKQIFTILFFLLAIDRGRTGRSRIQWTEESGQEVRYKGPQQIRFMWRKMDSTIHIAGDRKEEIIEK